MSSLKNVEDYLSKKYIFKFNEVLKRTFYCERNAASKEFKLLDDYSLNSIHRELLNSTNNIGKRQLNSLLESEFVPKYNPILDYFENLPPWDGHTDYIDEYLSSIVTTDDKNFRWAFKKWFVAMIACALDPKVTNHCAIILIGKQGIGKSTWFNNLLPPILSDYFFSGRINPNDKDTLLQLSECIIIVMEEIGSFSRAHMEAFKDIITKESVRQRRAYGVYSENYIRRASFVGSTNNKTVLNDITGNRRFLVFEALKFKSTKIYDLDKVYSQGFALSKGDFRYWFDLPDISKINALNEKYRLIADEEEYLLKYYKKPKSSKETISALSASEIISQIEENEKKFGILKLSPVEMGKVLNAKGFKIKNKKYQLVKINQ